jgi:hypothetical protein
MSGRGSNYVTYVTMADCTVLSRSGNVTCHLLMLDSFTEPGISEAQFRGLFSKCHCCSLYMTRRTVNYHICVSGSIDERIFIDLTGDSDSDPIGASGSDD